MGDVILGASDFLASIFLLAAFLFLNELRCSKKVTFLILITFVSGSFLLFVKFVLPGTAAGISSAAALTIPSMSKKECKVELFRASVNELASHSRFQGKNMLNYQAALDVHLAHEFFHFLEYKRGQFVSAQLDRIQTLTLPFFTRYAHISRCSEIAAHAFAKELLGLPVLPNFYDYLYLIDLKKTTQKDFDAMYDSNCKILYQS